MSRQFEPGDRVLLVDNKQPGAARRPGRSINLHPCVGGPEGGAA